MGRHLLLRLVFGPPENISGMHKIRLLPYSTATLNPLSLTYCLPPGSREPTYIPVVFNNSAPYQVSFNLRSLETQELTIESVPADKMVVAPGWHSLRLEGEEEDEEADAHNLQKMVKRNKVLELERYHSVRPSEALSVIPPDLTSSETLLFLVVRKPSVVTLNQVVDRRGDQFNLAPHREAVIIECPSGGDFVGDESKAGKLVPYKPKPKPLVRCIGQEEVVMFSARGVAPLKAMWKQWINDVPVNQGAVEGIEDTETISDAEKGHFRRDKVSKSHVVPLRVEHKRAGKSRVSLTSVVDALGNTYTPGGNASSIEFEILNRRSVSFDCPRPIQLLVGGTARLPIKTDGPIEHPVEISYRFTAPNGDQEVKSITVDARNSDIIVDRPGSFALLDVSGTCPGTILEPAKCSVQLVQQPTVDINVETIHEWCVAYDSVSAANPSAVDVGLSVNFEFTGTPPFTVHWTEKRKGEKPTEKRSVFNTPVGQLDLRPDREGKYTYTFDSLSDKRYEKIALNRAPITQVVHPPASVEILSNRRLKYWACSPDEINIDLAIKVS
jgi:nucleoporin POM152